MTMKVQDIMKSAVEIISPMESTKEAARKMHDLHIGSLPVVDNGQLVGMITDRDICVRVTATGRDAISTRVKEVMGNSVKTCHADLDIEEAAKLMIDHHIRRLVVLDANDTISGFLSVDDLAKTSHELASKVLEATIPIH
jgi:CBS domain-containing protein